MSLTVVYKSSFLPFCGEKSFKAKEKSAEWNSNRRFSSANRPEPHTCEWEYEPVLYKTKTTRRDENKKTFLYINKSAVKINCPPENTKETFCCLTSKRERRRGGKAKLIPKSILKRKTTLQSDFMEARKKLNYHIVYEKKEEAKGEREAPAPVQVNLSIFINF